MASFTRDWQESLPNGSSYANQLDTFITQFRTDISDRIKAMIYGFTAGENDGYPGFKQLEFKQQSSAASTPQADEIVLYALGDGSNCGLYAKEENGNAAEFLKYDGSNWGLNGDVLLPDTVDEDAIRLDNNSYMTGRNAADNGDINIIKVNASDVPEILVGAALSASTAPSNDADIANKKYVDDQCDAHIGVAGQSHAEGSTVFNTTVTAANTWQDLDLSSYIGSNVAMCYFEVSVSGAISVYMKPKGFGGATVTDHLVNNGGGCGYANMAANDVVYMMCAADSSGIIQIAGSDTVDTITIKLINFIR